MNKKEKNERKKQKRRETKRKSILKLQKLRGKKMDRKELSSQMEAVKAHEALLVDALESEKWMTAVWKVCDGKLILSGRTTWNFPKGDLIEATNQLMRDCKSEVDASPVTAFGTPLPHARAVCEPDIRTPFGIVNTDDNAPQVADVPSMNPIGAPPVFVQDKNSSVINEMPEIRAYPEEAKENKSVMGEEDTDDGGPKI